MTSEREKEMKKLLSKAHGIPVDHITIGRGKTQVAPVPEIDAMTQREKKELKNLLQELRPDKITINKDNVVTLKWSYFYRHGKSPEHYRDLLCKLYPEAFVVELRDDWRAWPKGSYFVVKFVRLMDHLKTRRAWR